MGRNKRVSGVWRVLILKDGEWMTYVSNMSHTEAVNLVEEEEFKLKGERKDSPMFMVIEENEYRDKLFNGFFDGPQTC